MQIVKDLYRDYGLYINRFRAFPEIRDGFKPIERRVILSAGEVALNSFVKSSRIDGHCIGKYSPHGSAYGTIVQLVRRGFLIGQGNWGCNIGMTKEEAAAPRYTEAMLSPLGKMFLELKDFVEWEKLEMEEEPIYLPAPIPACLIGSDDSNYVQGIGFGFKTVIPVFKIEDILQRLEYILGYRDKITIWPITSCEILSTEEDMEKILTTGKGSLAVRGKYSVDTENFQIILSSWPPTISFENILQRLKMEDKIGFVDLSQRETKIVFETIKRNRATILEELEKKLREAITSNLNFELVLVDENGTPELISIDRLLEVVYSYYLEANKRFLQEEEERLTQNIKEIEIVDRIRPYIHLGDIRSISEKTGIQENSLRKIMQKYSIIKLVECPEISDLKKRLSINISNQRNVSEYIIKKVRTLTYKLKE